MTTQKALKGMPKKFSYSSLSHAVHVRIKELEAKIHTHLNPKNKNVFEVGKALIEAKEKLPYGQFTMWVETIVDMSQETAQKYMKVTRHFEGKYYFFLRSASLAALVKLTTVPSSYLDYIMENDIKPTIESIEEYKRSILGETDQQPSKALVQLKSALPDTSDTAVIQDLASQMVQMQQQFISQLSTIHAIERYVIPPEVQEEMKNLQSRLEALQSTHQEVLQANRALSQQNEELNKKLKKLKKLIQYFADEYSCINEGGANCAH